MNLLDIAGVVVIGITDFGQVYTLGELAAQDVIFAVTGGSLLPAAQRGTGWMACEALLMRSKHGLGTLDVL